MLIVTLKIINQEFSQNIFGVMVHYYRRDRASAGWCYLTFSDSSDNDFPRLLGSG